MSKTKSLEDQIADTLEPLIDEVISVREDLNKLKSEIPLEIKSNPEIIDILKGEKGEKGECGLPGKDAEFDVNAVADAIKTDVRFYTMVKGVKGDKGDDGKDAEFDSESVAQQLRTDKVFRESIRGFPGLDGEKGEKGDPGKDGRDGKDAEFSPELVAEVLKTDGSFLVTIKGDKGDIGDKGEKGDQGLPGVDGKNAVFDAESVAYELKADKEFVTSLKGEKGDAGKDGADCTLTVEDVAINLKSDDEFKRMVKGPRGEIGEKGEPGERGERGERGWRGEKGADGINGRDGKDGRHGKDAPEIDVDELAEKLIWNPDFVEKTTAKNGRDGLGIDAEIWTPKIYREGDVVQHYIGQYFRAYRDTADEPGTSKDWIRQGKLGFRFRGGYKEGEKYEEGDLILVDYGLFLWTGGEKKMLVGRGPQGKKGDTGEKGLDGKDGIHGKDGTTIEVIEMQGNMLAFVTRSADGIVKTDTIDITKAIEPILKDVAKVQKSLDKVQKATTFDDRFIGDLCGRVEKALLDHPADDTAVPIRFFRGMWSVSATYHPGDVFLYGDRTIICTREVKGVPPDSMFDGNAGSFYLGMAVPGGGGGDSSGTSTAPTTPENVVQNVSFAAASSAINLAAGNIINIDTITSNLTLTAPVNPAQGKTYTYILRIDGVGNRTVTFPDGIVFSGLAANDTYAVQFMYVGTDFILLNTL